MTTDESAQNPTTPVAQKHQSEHCFHPVPSADWLFCSCTDESYAPHFADPPKDGDWECPMCGFTFKADHTNFDGGLSCPLCDALAQHDALQAAEGHLGLFLNAWDVEDAYFDAPGKRGEWVKIKEAREAVEEALPAIRAALATARERDLT